MNNTQSSISLDALHIDFKEKYAGMSAISWQKQLVFYINKILLFSGNPTDERMVTGWVAALCERAYYVSAYKKTTNIRLKFEYQLNKIVASTLLPKFLTRPGQIIYGKRQPSFMESILPTIERFHVMERLSEVFYDGVDSIIIGGSMSYAPFFSVRGNQNEREISDIDVLIVINDDFFKKSSWKKFLKSNLFPMAEGKKFLDRIKIFQKLFRANSVDVFSQRFSVSEKSFTASIHFMHHSVFKKMAYTDLEESLRAKSDVHYIMRDFKESCFTHPCYARHTFDGGRIESAVDGYKINHGGFVSFMPGYTISNGKFYPGVYHTMISPAFLIFYDRTGDTTRLVKKFENILNREAKCIQKKFPLATYAKAHNRYDIFSPGRFEEGLNSFLSAKDIKKYISPSNFNIVGIESDALPGEAMISEMFRTRRNKFIYDAIKNSLGKWKRETLKKATIDIERFIHRGNFEIAMSLAKKQDRCWYTITTIQSIKKVTMKLPCPYKHVNSNGLVVRKELGTQIITPSDIMQLDAYCKLTRKSGKVYVASIMDPADECKCSPMSYALIIPITT